MWTIYLIIATTWEFIQHRMRKTPGMGVFEQIGLSILWGWLLFPCRLLMA